MLILPSLTGSNQLIKVFDTTSTRLLPSPFLPTMTIFQKYCLSLLMPSEVNKIPDFPHLWKEGRKGLLCGCLLLLNLHISTLVLERTFVVLISFQFVFVNQVYWAVIVCFLDSLSNILKVFPSRNHISCFQESSCVLKMLFSAPWQ